MWSLIMGGAYSSEEEEEKMADSGAAEGNPSPKADLAGLHSGAAAAAGSNKVQMSPPSRERGDGSEASAASPAGHQTPAESPTAEHKPPGKISAAADRKPKLIHLPETNIKLDKLPPIRPRREVDLPQTAPSTPLVPMPAGQQLARQNSAGGRLPSSSTSSGSRKDPKFVPYEPYKAAVCHLVEPAGGRRRAKNKETPPAPRHKSVSRAASPQERSVEARELERRLKEKDEELHKLKGELAEREKQIRIQTQINSEVKRLLVASVGEDIEAKVDYLTQDKARLAADIRHYASKISRDFEEKEQLSVESNLWKSKFLACSVIVDELARWKAALLHRQEEAEHQVRLLQHEHAVLWSTTADVYSLLVGLKTAFDPLAPPPAPTEAASLLGLADQALRVGRDLKERLVGDSKLGEMVAGREAPRVPAQMDTPAEEGLKELLSRPPVVQEGGEYSELASLAVSGAARPHLRKLGDKLTSPEGFKSCTHCHGTVHNI